MIIIISIIIVVVYCVIYVAVKSASSSSALDSSTQKFVNDVKDVSNNRDTYISLAKSRGNGDRIYDLYSDFDRLFGEYINSVMDHTSALMGQRDALHSHKVDPYIAGGAASSLGGLGAGLIAAGSAASHNQSVDDKRAYYNSQVSSTGYSQSSLQNQLSSVVAQIRAAAGKY